MALFGRDSLIASYQALPFLPDLAARRCGCSPNCRRTIATTCATPSRARSPTSSRRGEMTVFGETPHSPYYGTADATPLFLVLLDEYERWTGDAALVKALEPQARAALDWIDERCDRDPDGFVRIAGDPHRGWQINAGRTPGTRSCSADGAWPRRRSLLRDPGLRVRRPPALRAAGRRGLG